MDARNWKETIGSPREINRSTKMRRSPARYAVPALVVSEACYGESETRGGGGGSRDERNNIGSSRRPR